MNVVKNNKSITISICLDYGFKVELDRDGICVYTKNLIRALLNKKDVVLEIWCYKLNKKNVKKFLREFIKKHPRRIKIYSEQKSYSFIIKSKIKLLFYLATYILIKRGRFRFENTLISLNDYRQNALDFMIKTKSKASLAIAPHISLNKALVFKCPKVAIVHDLFTIPLRNLFIKYFPNIDDANRVQIDNINKYGASENGGIVTLTDYIRDTQILPNANISPKKIFVITTPVMIDVKSTSKKCISEREFRRKFNLADNTYMFLPTKNRPNKNIKLLIKALSIIKSKKVNLHLVTTANLKDVYSDYKLAKKLKVLDLIHETGNLDTDWLYSAYKYSSLVFSPTIIEGPGMPHPILEALSVGNIPIISVKSMGIKESLKSVGLSMHSAKLNWVELNDYKGAATKILYVLQNKEDNIKKQSNILKRYVKHTWDDTAEQYIKIAKLLSKNR